MFNSFDVKASSLIDNQVVSVPYNRPTTSINQGYITLIFKAYGSQTDVITTTVVWSIVPRTSGSQSNISSTRMDINISPSSGKIYFTMQAGLTDQQASGLVYAINSDLSNYDTTILFNNAFNRNGTVEFSFQSTLIGYEIGGNVGSLSGVINNNRSFTLLYGSDSREYTQLQDLLLLIGQMQNTLSNVQSNTNKANLYLLQGKTSLQNLETHAQTLISQMQDANLELDSIDGRLEQIYDKLVNMNSSDSDKVDEFNSNSDSQSNQLNDMNDQLVVNKPSSETVAGDVDSNIDYDAIGVFGAVLSPFMGNQMIVKMMLIALSICLVSYIFFGKRG